MLCGSTQTNRRLPFLGPALLSISRTSYALLHWKVLSSCLSKRNLRGAISPFIQKIFTALMRSELVKRLQFHVMFILSVFIKRLF